MDRRDFLKLSAASSATATLAGCGNPELPLIRFIPEEELIPGIASWKPGVCTLCSSGCGLTVRVMEGEAEVVRDGKLGLIKMGLAKKLEGNPDHPINRGRLCVRGQAAIQVTYHPDRLRNPLRRTGTRGAGQYEEISWDDAIAELVSRLDALAAAGTPDALSFLVRPGSGQRQRLIELFLSGFGAPPPIEFEVFSDRVLRQANARSFGRNQLPTFDIANSRYVIGFGADFLGTWGSVVAQNLAFGDMRRGRPGIRGKFLQFEPRMSQTGANADEWVPLKPGTEGALALGIAHELIASGSRPAAAAGRAGAAIAGWANGLPDHSPEQVETITGVAADRIRRIAREFAGNAPAVAVIGGAPLAQTNGMFNALAVNALNALAGSVGQPGGMFFTPQPAMPGVRASGADRPVRTIEQAAAEILAASTPPIQLLMLHEANPVFGAPPAWQVREALSQIPYIVSFGNFIDETSILADLILPDHSFLESWVDHVAESGSPVAVASVAAPVMRPLYHSRPMTDVLLDVGRRLGAPLNPALPWASYADMLREAFSTLPGSDAFTVWNAAQQRGGWWGEVPAQADGGQTSAAAPAAIPAAWTAAEFDGDAAQFPFHFLPYSSQSFLDGSLAHLPWLQELPDAVATAMWSSWVEINPRTAEELGIRLGDLVEVASAHGTLQAPALLSPGIAPDMVAMPAGQGHSTFTRYASSRGANPMAILAPAQEPETGTLAWAATRVRIARVEGRGDLVLFAGSLTEHPHQHR